MIDRNLPENRIGVRIALVGQRKVPIMSAAYHLFRRKRFKMVRMDDGVINLVKRMYTTRLHKRVHWEQSLQIYDALYKIDPNMHIDYLVRKMMQATRDVVVPNVRYLNEVEKLVQIGFVLVRVTSTPKKNIQVKAAKHAASGLLQLHEYFGHDFNTYPVSYSIIADEREKMNEMLDIIVEKERAKLPESSEINEFILEKERVQREAYIKRWNR